MTKPLALSPEYRATVRAALRRHASMSAAERIARIENATPSLVAEALRLNAFKRSHVWSKAAKQWETV